MRRRPVPLHALPAGGPLLAVNLAVQPLHVLVVPLPKDAGGPPVVGLLDQPRLDGEVDVLAALLEQRSAVVRRPGHDARVLGSCGDVAGQVFERVCVVDVLLGVSFKAAI